MQHLCEALKRLGIEEDLSDLPDIDRCEIVSTEDEVARMEEGADQESEHIHTR
jgi:serine O-acetyltransferase